MKSGLRSSYTEAPLDKDTFTRLALKQQRTLYRVAISYTGHLPDAEDAMEIQLDFFDPACDTEIQAAIERDWNRHPEGIPDLAQRISNVPLLRQLFAEGTDGMIDLTIPYTVPLYSESDAQLYAGVRQGEISFQIQIQ